jgi:hypothetical protein
MKTCHGRAGFLDHLDCIDFDPHPVFDRWCRSISSHSSTKRAPKTDATSRTKGTPIAAPTDDTGSIPSIFAFEIVWNNAFGSRSGPSPIEPYGHANH